MGKDEAQKIHENFYNYKNKKDFKEKSYNKKYGIIAQIRKSKEKDLIIPNGIKLAIKTDKKTINVIKNRFNFSKHYQIELKDGKSFLYFNEHGPQISAAVKSYIGKPKQQTKTKSNIFQKIMQAKVAFAK